MSAALFTIATAGILTLEGVLLLYLLSGKDIDAWLGFVLGYPAALLLNALMFFACILLRFPLTLGTIGAGHAALLLLLTAGVWVQKHLSHRRFSAGYTAVQSPSMTTGQRWVFAFCLASIVLVLACAAVYVALPLHLWDAYTNWNLRALQAFTDQKFLFTDTYKPQYPILLHATQILFALPSGWHDPIVNGATFLLSLTALFGIFLLIKKSHGSLVAIIAVAAMTAVPIASLHLRQGYADIHVAEYTVLAALLFAQWARTKQVTHFIFSGVFVAAAVWTKIDGLYLALIPWLLLSVWIILKERQFKESRLWVVVAGTTVASIPWFIFLYLQKMELSPHSNTFVLLWKPSNFLIIGNELLLQTSMGMHWWVLLFAFVIFVYERSLKKMLTRSLMDPTLMWAAVTFSIVLFTYVFTGEGHQLPRHASLPRVMLTSTFLFTIALIILYAEAIKTNKARATSEADAKQTTSTVASFT